MKVSSAFKFIYAHISQITISMSACLYFESFSEIEFVKETMMRIALTANETYSVNLNKEKYRKFNKRIRVV